MSITGLIAHTVCAISQIFAISPLRYNNNLRENANKASRQRKGQHSHCKGGIPKRGEHLIDFLRNGIVFNSVLKHVTQPRHHGLSNTVEAVRQTLKATQKDAGHVIKIAPDFMHLSLLKPVVTLSNNAVSFKACNAL